MEQNDNLTPDRTAQQLNVSFFRFEDLRVYGKAADYAAWVCNQLANPRNESDRALVGSFCHSAYDGEFRLPLVLAQASPIFHSSCEGKLGIALE